LRNVCVIFSSNSNWEKEIYGEWIASWEDVSQQHSR
jgi:hypothetical protein